MDVYFLGWPGWSDDGYDISILEKIIMPHVEATIKTLATKDDLAKATANLKDDLSNLRHDIRKVNTGLIKWMFIFWLGQVAATFIIFSLFVKK